MVGILRTFASLLLLPIGAPPNIILIVADDLGFAELGCYGQKKIRTPNIDRRADEGMRLMRHYSGSPVCAPSRAVLIMGATFTFTHLFAGRFQKRHINKCERGTLPLHRLGRCLE